MPLSRSDLQMVADLMDTEYVAQAGVRKPLRFFSAEDCFDYARRRNCSTVGKLGPLIMDADVMTVGELIAREVLLDEQKRTCPRCDFQQGINDIVVAGEWILEHYGARKEQLNDNEKRIVTMCREWLTDDTIARCLDMEA